MEKGSIDNTTDHLPEKIANIRETKAKTPLTTDIRPVATTLQTQVRLVRRASQRTELSASTWSTLGLSAGSGCIIRVSRSTRVGERSVRRDKKVIQLTI